MSRISQAIAFYVITSGCFWGFSAGAGTETSQEYDDTSMLQLPVKKAETEPDTTLTQKHAKQALEKRSSKHKTKQDPTIGSFIPTGGSVCFQGPHYESMLCIAGPRANPGAAITSHTGVQDDVTCAELGFPQLAMERDTCWPTMSIYAAEGANVTSALADFRAGSMGIVADYADHRGIDHAFTFRWNTCELCSSCDGCDVSSWWGDTQSYSPAECATIRAEVGPILQRASGLQMGALISDAGGMCFEGQYDYMAAALGRVMETPMYAMFTQQNLQASTCAALGYDSVRDARNEIWPDAMTCMRSATEAQDMGNWIAGGPGNDIYSTCAAYDTEHGLPDDNCLEWVTCHVCEPGGANRDRGMLVTMEGAYYDDRFSDEFCAEVLANNTLLELGAFPKASVKVRKA